MLKKIAKKLLPANTRRGRFVKSGAAKVGLAKPVEYQTEYQHWIRFVEPEMFLPIVQLPKGKAPLFSIVVPFYNTKDNYLFPLLDSIAGQSFGDWELIVADASSDSGRRRAIKQAAEYDGRFTYHSITRNEGISGNTNQALKYAKGKYIVFCDHDDTLSPHALNEVAAKIASNPSYDIMYSDEDKISDDGKWRHSPFFKPDWSPHLFLNTNYTNHLSVIRRELVEKAGGLRPEFDGSQDYDLLLRIHRQADKPLQVGHIDKILYHWREAAGSTATNHNSKSYAFEAGRKALQEYVNSGPVAGEVQNIPHRPGFYQHKLSPATITKSIIYVGVGEDMAVNKVVADRLASLTAAEKIKAVFTPISSKEIDAAPPAEKNDHTAVFKFRAVAYPEGADWLDRLVGALELPDVACVSPRIVSADGGRIVDMGVVNDGQDNAYRLFEGLASNDQTPAGHVEWVRDVDALSGAVIGRSGDTSQARKHHVVWSYVTFYHQPIFSHSTYFNSNLSAKAGKSQKTKVAING